MFADLHFSLSGCPRKDRVTPEGRNNDNTDKG